MYWGDYSEFKGQKVLEVSYNKDQILIKTDKGTLKLGAYGDCCSSSWFEHVDDDGVAGGEITEIEFTGDPSKPDEERGENGYVDEVIRFYAGAVRTTKGRICFEMRNSSNGYYGGELEVEFEAA